MRAAYGKRTFRKMIEVLLKGTESTVYESQCPSRKMPFKKAQIYRSID